MKTREFKQLIATDLKELAQDREINPFARDRMKQAAEIIEEYLKRPVLERVPGNEMDDDSEEGT